MNGRLKNWITIFKSIKNGKKGLLTYLNYLNNDNHQNHLKSGHKIINFNNNWQNIFSNIVSKIEDRETKKLLNGKGGRTATKFGQSVTLNIPYIIDEQKIKPIADKIILEFYKQIHKKEKLFSKKEEWTKFKNDLLYYNVHQQPNGSKTQFNFILSEYIGDKKLDLSKKKYSYLFKTVSNSILKEYGYDNNNYTIQNQHKQSKNTKIYKQNQLDSLIEDVEEQKQQYNFYLDRLKNIEDDTDKTLKVYLNRLKNAAEDNDTPKIEKLERQIKIRTKKLNIDLADFPHP